MPLVRVLTAMERTGMYVDPARLAELGDALGAQIEELEGRIRTLAGDDSFNISSPMQLSHVLFDVMGLPTKGLKKTHRGYYSTNAKVLEELAKDHEVVRLILGVSREDQDQVHLPRHAGQHARQRRPRAHHLQPNHHGHGASLVVQPQPAEHPHPL